MAGGTRSTLTASATLVATRVVPRPGTTTTRAASILRCSGYCTSAPCLADLWSNPIQSARIGLLQTEEARGLPPCDVQVRRRERAPHAMGKPTQRSTVAVWGDE